MITADEVQFAYPNPKMLDSSEALRSAVRNEIYCVGGALCLYLRDLGLLEKPDNFPTTVAEKLQIANPSLTLDDAANFSHRIITKNDSGDFDEAWLALREALKWEPGE